MDLSPAALVRNCSGPCRRCTLRRRTYGCPPYSTRMTHRNGYPLDLRWETARTMSRQSPAPGALLVERKKSQYAASHSIQAWKEAHKKDRKSQSRLMVSSHVKRSISWNPHTRRGKLEPEHATTNRIIGCLFHVTTLAGEISTLFVKWPNFYCFKRSSLYIPKSCLLHPMVVKTLRTVPPANILHQTATQPQPLPRATPWSATSHDPTASAASVR